jgi:hypothetical protein
MYGNGPEIDWKLNWLRAGLWTTPWREHSHSKVVCNSSKTKQKVGGWKGGAAAGLLMKIHQNLHQNVIF